ncbi:LysR family transcriptional regulator [Halolactibacillus alkaliphilus]|uniref:LysR family transcriptional regulator n=1 Tax=Halolactibacillus alkaliphilus TaxID=442899 RepID=A0A511X003_9BACI|nr:LysR family transcriptional regulator [Halolactibacillus alkaliphilus]GEN56276.1 LysR family transcriptional regulator [Halolactibacillus alkaliphilus]GGN66249.1 LysR family transcriptional regulator [Halolactibacillus alkaliphilus]SFO67360.1 DNA-binding transcriptional regulator, LysR family [Halolactibacillus alkaliphilus]
MLDQKLLTFIKVVECKNYTKAAEALNLTQPAVSQHMKKLEAYYGTRLIEMKGKAINLTDQGKMVYNYVQVQRSNEHHLKNKLNQIAAPMRIGATLSIADYYLPKYLNDYLQKGHDNIAVSVNNTKRIIQLLLDDELDCAFIEGIFDKDMFSHHAFTQTDFKAVVSPGHPLLQKEASVTDLYQYPLLIREKGSGTRKIFEQYLTQQNDSLLSFKEIHEIGSFMLLKSILRNSQAVSFMYEKVVEDEVISSNLAYLSLKDVRLTRPLFFIYPKHSLKSTWIQDFYAQFIPESAK